MVIRGCRRGGPAGIATCVVFREPPGDRTDPAHDPTDQPGGRHDEHGCEHECADNQGERARCCERGRIVDRTDDVDLRIGPKEMNQKRTGYTRIIYHEHVDIVVGHAGLFD